LEKDEQRLGGHPDDQKESDSHDSQHYERPEMMINQAGGASAGFLQCYQMVSARKRGWIAS
jgi:hypothetical protein